MPDWDEREQIFKMSGKIVRTTNITQSAVGHKDGLWTTVFAAAVFINDDSQQPIETARALAVSNKGSVQEVVLRQTIEGQAKNAESHHDLALPNKESAKSSIEPARSIPSRKSAS